MRLPCRIDGDRLFVGLQDCGDLLRQRCANLAVGDVLVELVARQRLGDARGGGDAEIAGDQKVGEFFKGFRVQLALGENRRNAFGKLA